MPDERLALLMSACDETIREDALFWREFRPHMRDLPQPANWAAARAGGPHTLYCYTHVPSQVDGGWPSAEQAFADAIEARIEWLAPGFRALVLERAVTSPLSLERMNPNLVGGDLGGGSNAWHQQLLFRPMFPYFRYRMPVAGLYLCSSYAHPGAGVHGMCGYNAAQVALGDLGLKPRH